MHETDQLTALLNRYVDSGNLPGYSLLISRHFNELVYLQHGLADVERSRPVQRDTVFRIYSMTKPVTSAALMQLWERDLFNLDDPVHQYIPEWSDLQVYDAGSADDYTTCKPARAMTIRDLLTHTSGLTYGLFNPDHPVDQLYLREGIANPQRTETQADRIKKLAALPLLFSPGTRWTYSFATDVAGYLVELLSGQRLDVYFRNHITGPLGMTNTDFHVAAHRSEHFAACYKHIADDNSFRLQDDPATSNFLEPPALHSGGGGLVSTIDDYHIFCCAMLNAGAWGSTRILQPATVAAMTANQLPKQQDLSAMGQARFSETVMEGVGFGLGYAVMLDPLRAGVKTSPGEFNWGGMASTYHYIDPAEKLIVVFMTQLMPSSAYPIRTELKNAVYRFLHPAK